MSIWLEFRRNSHWITIALLSVLCLYGSVQQAQSQIPGASSNTYDSITLKNLDQLDRLLLNGANEEAELLLRQIINGVGPIKRLAGIFYKLAQNESDSEILVRHYKTIVDQWPSSAWAQKAAVELVPLILMSDGALGVYCESSIWQQSEHLLSPAADAASIGEDPVLLQSDVMLNLIHLAHFHQDANRVVSLVDRAGSMAYQDRIKLALAYALLQMGENTVAVSSLKQWFGVYPNSELRPFAILVLFLAAETKADRDSALGMMAETFSSTLEAIQLRGIIEES